MNFLMNDFFLRSLSPNTFEKMYPADFEEERSEPIKSSKSDETERLPWEIDSEGKVSAARENCLHLDTSPCLLTTSIEPYCCRIALKYGCD